MSESQSSTFLVIIAAVMSGIGGYFTRRLQKYEDSRDEAHLKILPQLQYLILSLIRSIDIYKEKRNFKEFKSRIDEVASKLGETISSGSALIARINADQLTDLYCDIQRLKIQVSEIEENKLRQDDLRDSFEKGNKDYEGWLKVNPKALLDNAKAMNQDLEKRIKGYRSISLTIIILIAIVAIIIAFVGLINNTIDSGVGQASNSTLVLK